MQSSVRRARHPLGQLHPSFPRIGVRAISILVLQIWVDYQEEVQVRKGSCGDNGEVDVEARKCTRACRGDAE